MRLTLFFIVMLSCLSFQISFAEPENLDAVKQDCIKYYNSGHYQKELDLTLGQALDYLRTRVTVLGKQRLAIILDIDETALSNYPDMFNMTFGGWEKEVNDAEGIGHDPVIEPTLKLYRYAKEHHVAVFFITGRTENYRPGTAKNLENVGYKNWDGLFLKPESYKEKSVITYKVSTRQAIEKQGYKIVLNIGDQMSDLAGGFAEKAVRVPNPFYFVP